MNSKKVRETLWLMEFSEEWEHLRRRHNVAFL